MKQQLKNALPTGAPPRSKTGLSRKWWLFRQSLIWHGLADTLKHTWRSLLFEALARYSSRRTVSRNLKSLRMRLDLKHGGISKTLFIYGLREADTERLCQLLLAPGMRVLDIGANIGYHALMAARTVGEKGFVLALEPDPRNLCLLHQNIHLNRYGRRMQVLECAVSDRSAIMPFGLHARSNLNALLDECATQQEFSKELKVHVLDVAHLLRKYGPFDFLRMDIEGHEAIVLKRIAELAENGANVPQRLIFEVHSHLYDKKRRNMAVILDRLARAGYRCVWMSCFDNQNPSCMHKRFNLSSLQTVNSEYHHWGLYADVPADIMRTAVCDTAIVRHVALVRKTPS